MIRSLLLLALLLPVASCARHDGAAPYVSDPIDPDPPIADPHPHAVRPRAIGDSVPLDPNRPGDPVPENSTLILLAVGLTVVSIASTIRRRRLRS